MNSCRSLLLVFAMSAGVAAGQSLNLEDGQLMVNSVPLNPFVRVLDGQWEGITVASDSNCYFASSTHDNQHGAAFFRYNPATGVVTMLTNDITRVCGENPTVTPPQGKLHSDIVEANGWLYFSTHIGNYWPEAYAAYTGSHVVGYQLATGQFRDFGVVRSNYTSYAAIGVDKVRQTLLVFESRWWGSPADGRLYRIDIATGVKEQLGTFAGDTCFWSFVDAHGDCWFSVNTDAGRLRCARSATGLIETWPSALPEPELGSNRAWAWAKALPDGNTCVFTMNGGSSVYFFNNTTGFTTLRNTGPVNSGLALGTNRVYYIQRPDRQVGSQEYADFHLFSVPLSTNAPIVDHGLVTDQSGRLVWRMPTMTTDTQGRVFGVGDWWLLPGEQGSPTGTLRHVDGPGTNYDALVRGEFFATWDFTASPTLYALRHLTLTTAGGGTATSDPPTNSFVGNAVATLFALPASGWQFLGWSGDAGTTNATALVSLTRNKVIQAVFGTAFTTTVTGNGSVTATPTASRYPYGTALQLTAQPQAGNYFAHWSNAATGNLSPLTYIVTNANATVTAVFSALPGGKATVTPIASGAGRVAMTPQTNLFNVGQIVILAAIPDSGQEFNGWSGDASGISNPLAITLNTSKTITANFTHKPYLVVQPLAATSSLQFVFSGELGGYYRIEASTNLVQWQTLGTLTNRSGRLQFTDPAADYLHHRFYRAVLPP